MAAIPEARFDAIARMNSIDRSPLDVASNSRDGLREVAQQFESIFLNQFLSNLTNGLESSDGHSIGGQDPYSQMLRDQYADMIAKNGGVGVADAVMRELLKNQEAEA